MTQASFSASMPSSSTIVPAESDSVTGFAPKSISFSTVYWATLPEPETVATLPRTLSPRVASISCGEVDGAVAGRLGADQRAAVGQALAGQHAVEAVGDALVLAEQEADLAAADADVAGRDVGVRADVAVELRHERLAEAHHLVVALALGVEVRAALAAAHRERGEAVLEDLLEGEELEHAEGDGRMEAQAALVGADRAVHLDAEAAVDLDLALVVHPGYAEHDDALGLDQPLEDARIAVGLGCLDHRVHRLDDLAHRLVELRLVGVPGHHLGHELLNRFR